MEYAEAEKIVRELLDRDTPNDKILHVCQTSIPEAFHKSLNSRFELGFDESEILDEETAADLTPLDLEILKVLETSIESRLKAGATTEVALAEAKLLQPTLAEHAMRRVIIRLKRVYKVPVVGTVVGDNNPNRWWYQGPTAESHLWLGLRSRLELEGKMSSSDIAVMDNSTTRTLGLMPSPGLPTFSGRGLVMGYVQSGKTTNFMGLIAKAADAGYRLVIVLSGVTNNLRDQTQSRLENSLVGDENLSWYWLTHKNEDFTTKHNANVLLSNPQNRIVAVVKKNKQRLNLLYRWLNSANSLIRSQVPILIIDDECDQATVNTAKQKSNKTAINRELENILNPNFMPRATYVGYSATPFANLLIDATEDDGLYPRDFIVSLDKSAGYFGATELFGRVALDGDENTYDGADILRDIPNMDVDQIKPPKSRNASWEPQIPRSLEDAIMWFAIAHAIREHRLGSTPWSTMMVHSSPNVEPQFKTASAIKDLIGSWSKDDFRGIEKGLRVVFEAEISRAAHLNDELTPSWEKLLPIVNSVLGRISILVDNYKSSDRLNYEEQEPRPVIVVGGNTLSRGLTLEGLVSTFFLRTSNAYDALMQMGRWFGYRPRYEDLQRIWLANDDPYTLDRWFRELAFVEDEIREQIDSYSLEGKTPLEIAVKIRQVPGMTITAAAKMRNAVDAQISYAESRIQTIIFDQSPTTIEANLEVTSRFIETVKSSGAVKSVNSDGWPVFMGVSSQEILEFIQDFGFHEASRQLQSKPILEYVSNLNKVDELTTWNVALYSNSRLSAKPYKVAEGLTIRMANRAPLIAETERFDIKTLISVGDMVADAPELKDKAKKMDSGKLRQSVLHALRKSNPGTSKIPLLGIYLIDKDSMPDSKDSKTRKPLAAQNHLVGLYMVFPESNSQQAVGYKMANISDRAELEELDDETETFETEDVMAVIAEVLE